MGEERLNTSFLGLQYTLQLLNHCWFSCVENLAFQRQTRVAWSYSAAICPFAWLAWAPSRAALPSVAIKSLFLAGFDEPLCSSARQHPLHGSRVILAPVFWNGGRGGHSCCSVCLQQQGSELVRAKVMWVSSHCAVSAHSASQYPLKLQPGVCASQLSLQKENHALKTKASSSAGFPSATFLAMA